jgi:broad specificity phosphatase PhoE
MTEVPYVSPIDRLFLTGATEVTELILVRHGQQVFPDPATATIADWVDPPLSAIGERQATTVGRYLSAKPVDAVFSSQLLRANATGRAIAERHGVEVQVMEDLREIETFRDRPRDARPTEVLGEIVLRGARERFVRHRTWDVYPATERHAEFRLRTANAIEGILALHPGKRVVVACHGGVINAYVGEVLGLDVAMFFRPAHASVHRVLAQDGVRALQSLNETHHLAGESDELVTY